MRCFVSLSLVALWLVALVAGAAVMLRFEIDREAFRN
jgi:hypothetical protein